MVLDTYERIAKCYYRDESPIHMECYVSGERDISIKEQNFNGFFASYKMKKLDSSIKAEKCNDSTDSASNNPKNSYLLLMILLLNLIFIY